MAALERQIETHQKEILSLEKALCKSDSVIARLRSELGQRGSKVREFLFRI